MKQLTQKLKSGEMQVLEVPVPPLKPGTVLVRNYYSVVSAGTEGSTVKAARKGYIGKAKERPDQFKQVLGSMKEKGLLQTYRAVMKKLDAHSPLGYSSVGEVKDVAQGVREFRVGDLVACAGLTASHAEVVCVPVNLCVKLSAGTDLKQAAYNTLGAVAMQGVRQADLRLGETCSVIGLGLLGQLTGILLKASGIKVVGIDVSETMVTHAAEHSADLALNRNTAGIEKRIMEFTNGIGCDGVLITAASDSLDPVNFGGAIARKKGTIVVVGSVPTGFDREPHFYKKELTLRMSCSYGPGRYDPAYEEKGLDYPAGYVRWTEKRNMQAFQDLIASKSIDIRYLTTHTFRLDEAPAAYDMILNKSEPHLGLLIEYDTEKPISSKKVEMSEAQPPSPPSTSSGLWRAKRHEAQRVVVGFIGAGSYAQGYLLPNIPKEDGVVLKGVMTGSSTGSRSVADRFGFQYCTGDAEDILKDPEINTVFIATRHDSHAKYVLEALSAGKHVFVEKPLCLTREELDQIAELMAQGSRLSRRRPEAMACPEAQGKEEDPPGGDHASSEALRKSAEGSALAGEPQVQIANPTTQRSAESVPLLMVGYNRRFSPLARILKEKVGPGPMAMLYRINAGTIPFDAWIQDRELGGGRIIGEVCHFIDLLTYVNGSLPISVHAVSMDDPDNLNDTLSISLGFEKGSIGTILYVANGSKALHKEFVEIHAHGTTAVLRDFRELEIYGNGKPFRRKLISQDKGQRAEVRDFIDAVKRGEPVISFEEIVRTTEATFKVLESQRTGKVVPL
jgi:predicted dehydrogenase/threonine dehydrogenase-like Zn-dependent dehydrogenase